MGVVGSAGVTYAHARTKSIAPSLRRCRGEVADVVGRGRGGERGEPGVVVLLLGGRGRGVGRGARGRGRGTGGRQAVAPAGRLFGQRVEAIPRESGHDHGGSSRRQGAASNGGDSGRDESRGPQLPSGSELQGGGE